MGSKKSLSSGSFSAAAGPLSNKLKRRKTNWIWQQSKNIFWDPTQRMPPCPAALLALLRWWVEPFAFSLPESGFDQACSLLDQLALPRDCSRDHQTPEHSARLSFLPQITMIDIWPWVRSAPPAEHLWNSRWMPRGEVGNWHICVVENDLRCKWRIFEMPGCWSSTEVWHCTRKNRLPGERLTAQEDPCCWVFHL